MKQTLFETRQRAEDLMKEAIAIWKQSNQSERLEGIEDDPVFSLLMTALAYQANEIDSEIEQLKAEVLGEFAQMLVPYDLGHALPATVVVTTAPAEQIAVRELNERSVFTLANSPFQFVPLLKTTIFNSEIKSVVRLDARRWKVSLSFKQAVANLSGLSFLISNPGFQDLKVSIGRHTLPLIKPWDYSNLPLSECFSLNTMLYDQSLTYQVSLAWLDLFAKQDVRLFSVDTHDASTFIPVAQDKFDLIFEFSGIKDDFLFDKTLLVFNCVPLVNVEVHAVNLSSTSPIARISGIGKVDGGEEVGCQQFLHLIHPSRVQFYKDEQVVVRRVATDRFNWGGLLRLTKSLVNKYTSDFYAFQDLVNLRNGKAVYQLYDSLRHLSNEVSGLSNANSSGVYVMLKNYYELRDKNVSLEVRYLTTFGSQVNKQLGSGSLFGVPGGIDAARTKVVVDPVPGSDEVQGLDAETCLARYYMITNDRIVTLADIKIFCYKELLVRYGVTMEMIKDIKVRNRRDSGRWTCGYEIIVDIMLVDNAFIKRSFVNKIPRVELWLQRMIEVRSSNIFPVQVNIRIV